MQMSDVVQLLDFLERSGLEVYVDGGWAVDALLGEQTRVHDDLDVAVPHGQVPLLRRLMRLADSMSSLRLTQAIATSFLRTLPTGDSTFTRTPLMPPARM